MEYVIKEELSNYNS